MNSDSIFINTNISLGVKMQSANARQGKRKMG